MQSCMTLQPSETADLAPVDHAVANRRAQQQVVKQRSRRGRGSRVRGDKTTSFSE